MSHQLFPHELALIERRVQEVHDTVKLLVGYVNVNPAIAYSDPRCSIITRLQEIHECTSDLLQLIQENT